MTQIEKQEKQRLKKLENEVKKFFEEVLKDDEIDKVIMKHEKRKKK